MKMRRKFMAIVAALGSVAGFVAVASAGPFSGGIGSAMIYGPYTGGFGYSYATAYSYSLPFTNNGFSSPWVYPYDWTSTPWNGYSYPGRPLFNKAPSFFAVSAPMDLQPVPPASALSTPAPVVISVHVPAEAELWFDGNKTQQTGSDRTFQSPPLAAGKAFNYSLRARWMEDGKAVEQVQIVKVQAGQQAGVTFPAR
jgi:uncharacterized protein (TIGR03000 family)